jgi:hypothetical protein
VFPAAEVVISAAELAYIERPHARDFATPAWTKYLFADRRVRTIVAVDPVPWKLERAKAFGAHHTFTTDEERGAMKERAQELKAAARRGRRK